MRTILATLISACLASFTGLATTAVVQHLDPDLHFIQGRMYGTCAFALTILACMLLMRGQASAREF